MTYNVYSDSSCTSLVSGGSPEKGPPRATILEPAKDATYRKGQVVHAHYTCTDSKHGPGIASCVGTVANGAAINTSTSGRHAFTVVATSLDGKSTTVTVYYNVRT